MKKFILVLIIIFSIFNLQAQGDDPCSATSINVNAGACNFTTYTNQGATNSTVSNPGCANYTGKDVWFSVSVPSSGNLIFDSDNGDITDLGMAVYNSDTNDCNNLILIECDDDGSANGAMSMIELNGLVPGSTIWIRLWEYGGDNNGTFDFCVWEPVPPVNDEPCGAIDLTIEPVCNMSTYDNTYSTASDMPDTACANYNGADVWFTTMVPANGNIYIKTEQGEITEAGLAVYMSLTNDCNDLVLYQCIDNGEMPIVSLTGLTPGNVIWIRFWENGGDNNGDFDICVTYNGPPDCSTSTPASDSCSTATFIYGSEVVCGNTSDTYTDDPTDPSIFCGSIENSSWISFEAASDSAVFYVWTMNCQNNDGIQMEIYETSDCVNYSSVSNCISTGAEEDFVVTATGLVIGETYYIMIDGWGGDVCDYVVSSGEGMLAMSSPEKGTNTASNDFKIFPNPAESLIQIEYSSEINKTIEIYSILGVLVKSIQSSNSKTTVDVSRFEKGIYLVKVGNNIQKLQVE